MTSTHDRKEMIMHEYAEHEAQNESFTAMVCEQAALFGATPGPDEFDNRPVWDKGRGDRRRHQGLRYPARRGRTRRHAIRRRAGEPPLGLRQHPRRADTEARPRRRQAHPRYPRTPARTGRIRDPLARTRTRDRQGADNSHGSPRRLRSSCRDAAAEVYRAETGEVWRPRRGSHVSQTGKLTSAVIEARDFQRATKGPREHGPPPAGNARRRRGRKGSQQMPAKSSCTSTRSRPSTPTSSSSTAVARVRRKSRQDGPSGTASTRSSASPTGTPTAGPLPSAATTSCSTSCPRAWSRSPVRASRTTSSTRRKPSAFPSRKSPPDADAPRVASQHLNCGAARVRLSDCDEDSWSRTTPPHCFPLNRRGGSRSPFSPARFPRLAFPGSLRLPPLGASGFYTGRIADAGVALAANDCGLLRPAVESSSPRAYPRRVGKIAYANWWRTISSIWIININWLDMA